MPKFVVLWTDASIWLLAGASVVYVLHVRRQPNLAARWAKVFRNAPALASAIVLLAFLAVTLLDSVHFRSRLPATTSATDSVAYDAEVRSLLDVLLWRVIESREATYSRPFAWVGFTKETLRVDGELQRVAPRLAHGGAHLSNPGAQWLGDVAWRGGAGLVAGAIVALLAVAVVVRGIARRAGTNWGAAARDVLMGATLVPWRAALITLLTLCMTGGAMAALMAHYHVFGTDVTGNDVLYQTLKSIRTAFVIGGLATLITLPLAVVLGIAAGYLKGWVDEAIQYLYTVLSSVPNILLIAACVLMVQVFLDKHPELFQTGVERADLKLFLLCAVLGLTGWAGLCRLLRGETLKLRELEFVQAARAFGVSDARIMLRHILPNAAHLMLIVSVLEFSALILYEAVLSYVGIGVDPTMNSFGGMINFARVEASRDPVVWWPFTAAFVFMVTLVLAANLFADGVQQAFDPRRMVSPSRLRRFTRRASRASR